MTRRFEHLVRQLEQQLQRSLTSEELYLLELAEPEEQEPGASSAAAAGAEQNVVPRIG
jgi:hypothetical protein